MQNLSNDLQKPSNWRVNLDDTKTKLDVSLKLMKKYEWLLDAYVLVSRQLIE